VIPFQFNKAFTGKREGCLEVATSLPRLTKVDSRSLECYKNKGCRTFNGVVSSGKSWTPFTLGITGFMAGDGECFSLFPPFPPYYLK